MTEQQEQNLKSLKVKFAQQLAVLRQTLEESPRLDTSWWAGDLKDHTAMLDGLAVSIQEVFTETD